MADGKDKKPKKGDVTVAVAVGDVLVKGTGTLGQAIRDARFDVGTGARHTALKMKET